MVVSIMGDSANWLNLLYNAGFLGSFIASDNVHCPRCQPAQVYRHGQNPNGHYRFCCRGCHRLFQLPYAYEVRSLALKSRGLQWCRGSRYRQNTENWH